MKTLYKEGDKISYQGFKGHITQIAETYRKNVLIVKVTETPKHTNNLNKNHVRIGTSIGLFEMPDGTLEFMNIIE